MTKVRIPVSIWLLAAFAVLVSGSAVQADGEGERAAQFVFDARIVRVRSDATKGLEACPWEAGASASRTDWTWPAALEALEARGQIFVMLDQRVTTLESVSTSLMTDNRIPFERFDTRVGNSTVENETRRFDNLRVGAQVQLTSAHDTLQYAIDVTWLHWPTLREAVPTGVTSWNGMHRALAAGETLVLHARQHILGDKGEPEVAEIYCFLTGAVTR